MSTETHWLVILEPGEDYEIEHLEDCPKEVQFTDPEGHPIYMHTCLLGALITEAGLEDQGVEWRSLPVGRYAVSAWSQKYESTPYRPAEWDAGIALEPGKETP